MYDQGPRRSFLVKILMAKYSVKILMPTLLKMKPKFGKLWHGKTIEVFGIQTPILIANIAKTT